MRPPRQTRPEIDLIDARAAAIVARARLVSTLRDMQVRLSPRALARDAMEELREHGGAIAHDVAEAVRARPVRAAALAAAIAVFLARKPLARLLVTLFLRRNETREGDGG